MLLFISRVELPPWLCFNFDIFSYNYPLLDPVPDKKLEAGIRTGKIRFCSAKANERYLASRDMAIMALAPGVQMTKKTQKVSPSHLTASPP